MEIKFRCSTSKEDYLKLNPLLNFLEIEIKDGVDISSFVIDKDTLSKLIGQLLHIQSKMKK